MSKCTSMGCLLSPHSYPFNSHNLWCVESWCSLSRPKSFFRHLAYMSLQHAQTVLTLERWDPSNSSSSEPSSLTTVCIVSGLFVDKKVDPKREYVERTSLSSISLSTVAYDRESRVRSRCVSSLVSPGTLPGGSNRNLNYFWDCRKIPTLGTLTILGRKHL